jgi:adenylate cyclase
VPISPNLETDRLRCRAVRGGTIGYMLGQHGENRMPDAASDRVERRLAAILAADVAGYSRLMGRDEAGTLARLKALRRELIDAEVAEHRGRIVKTAGDGILIEFPSVVEAVACALAVQQGIAEHNAETPADERIEFRVGINLGDVIVEEGDIHGDGVNVAARLEALAEPGGICVSAIVRDQVEGRIECNFEDAGEQRLKNIARPVHVYRIEARSSGLPAAATAALALPDKPSVAVLPFANMSSDPEQEFLADGIAEDLITALSRYPSLFVIARNSSFTYKGRAVDVKQVGRELGVRYVLEGSLRKSGNRIRVTAQLIEAESGNHVWAERYDRDLADIFAVQDEITEAVTIAIAPAIAQAEQQRAMRKLPESLDAWAAYQRGLWHFDKVTVEDNRLAQQFFQKAVDLDPGFVSGYVGLAESRARAGWMFGAADLAESMNSALDLARKAVGLEPANPEARSCLAHNLVQHADYTGASAEAQRALAVSPNFAQAHAATGAALIFSGRPKEGLAAVQTSIRLDPHGSLLAHRLLHVTIAHYYAREYEAAVEAARSALRSRPDFMLPYRWLAAALGQLGRIEEAREALEKAIGIAPATFEMYVRNRVPWMRPEDHEHMLEGLRKAGWPG